MALVRYSLTYGASRLYPHDSASARHSGASDSLGVAGWSAERTSERAPAPVGFGRW
jgi:hypothetical protein